MAGDWIKFEKSTLDKPEVFEMAGILNLDPDAVIGKLLRVWDWFDDQSLDGYAPVTLAAQLNRNTGCAEFTAAMQQVGWMVIENDRLKIPNFTRHNGQTAKDRSLSAKRMAKSRGKSCGDSVTSSVTKAQPEKRREDKSNTPIAPKGEVLELPFPSTAFAEAWKTWVTHRKEIKKKLTEESIKQQFKTFSEWGESKSIAAILYTVGKGWQGLVESPNFETSKPKTTTAAQYRI